MMKGYIYILILAAFGFSAAGTAVGMVGDMVLTNGQELFVASIVGAILGNLVGWYLCKRKGLFDGRTTKRQIDSTP